MKYVRNPSYQNNFITIEFVQIDEKRREQEKERALPLTLWESFKYPKVAIHTFLGTKILLIN